MCQYLGKCPQLANCWAKYIDAKIESLLLLIIIIIIIAQVFIIN